MQMQRVSFNQNKPDMLGQSALKNTQPLARSANGASNEPPIIGFQADEIVGRPAPVSFAGNGNGNGHDFMGWAPPLLQWFTETQPVGYLINVAKSIRDFPYRAWVSERMSALPKLGE